ncbi:uncharacterized protein LOC142905762 [Petromyzon marinus]|uniref:uncharacterized protein LOC142905762 n=1 Tax=Petromyzon marinus TaxID=7757 RepID=UPI003F712729
MGLLGRVTLEVCLGYQVCTQEFYVSSVLCHECIAGTDLLEKLGLNVQTRQRCATVEGSGERILLLGQEPGRPRFEPMAAILASAVTVGPLVEMLLPIATPRTDPSHRPSGEVGKLTTYWRGPWTVVRQIPPWMVLIQGGERSRETVVNVRRLKLWRAAPAGETPTLQVPRHPGTPAPPMPHILDGFTPYMGPAAPEFPVVPSPERRRRARRHINPSAPEFVPQPADAGGQEEPLEWR